MSVRLRQGHQVFIYREYVDLRAGFDRLAMYVRDKMKSKLVDGDLFLFVGKSRKKLKAICFDGTGLLLIAKRLDRGCFMNITQLENPEISLDELDSLLRGSVIKRTHFGDKALTADASSSKVNSIHDPSSARDQYRDPQGICRMS
jgi:transposase